MQSCLALMVVVELTGLAGLVETLKESDQTRKLQHTLVGMVFLGVQSRPRVWKTLRIWEHPGSEHVDAKARRMHQGGDQYAPVVKRVGIG